MELSEMVVFQSKHHVICYCQEVEHSLEDASGGSEWERIVANFTMLSNIHT